MMAGVAVKWVVQNEKRWKMYHSSVWAKKVCLAGAECRAAVGIFQAGETMGFQPIVIAHGYEKNLMGTQKFIPCKIYNFSWKSVITIDYVPSLLRCV